MMAREELTLCSDSEGPSSLVWDGNASLTPHRAQSVTRLYVYVFDKFCQNGRNYALKLQKIKTILYQTALGDGVLLILHLI